MKEIAFILLVVVSSGWSGDFRLPGMWIQNQNGQYEKVEGVTDTWSGMQSSGDSATPAEFHYKAVLFQDSESLRLYLRNRDADGAVLINLKSGDRKVVHQRRVTKRIEQDEFDHYDVILAPEKPTP